MNDHELASAEDVSAMFQKMREHLGAPTKDDIPEVWDTYEEYLKSDSWRRIKDRFNYEYDGPQNICQVSGIVCNKVNLYVNHHHWSYPEDLHDDDPSNLILVCSSVHEWIHKDDNKINKKAKQSSSATRSGYLVTLIRLWNQETYKAGAEKGYAKGYDDAAEKISMDMSVDEFMRGYNKAKAELKEVE